MNVGFTQNGNVKTMVDPNESPRNGRRTSAEARSLDATLFDTAEEEDQSAKPVKDTSDVDEVKTFQELNLPAPLLEATAALNWHAPTKVQGMCLPFTLRGKI